MSKDNKIKMICVNPSCLNKAAVFRRFDIMKDQICFACKQVLKPINSPRYKRNFDQARVDRELKGLQ